MSKDTSGAQAAPPEPVTGEEISRLRTENAALKQELAEARKTNLQYLQNVAHQLTAPLNAIKWNIEALKDAEVSIPRKSKILSSIYSQGTILVHLIKNFTLMSNLEADHELGQFREKPEPADMLRLCINLANDFQPQAAENDMKILVNEASFEVALGKRPVLMVKNLIAQAVSNLLENAIKYGDRRSTIEISAKRMPVPPLPTSLALSVWSTGMPIKPEEVRQLFERGFRGGGARQKVPAGTGIGLYLANRVMKIHHGAMAVYPNGRVSRFVLVFPLSSLK